MKLLQIAIALCIFASGIALANKPEDKCGCSKPKPTPPAQVMKPSMPGHQKSACAPAPEQKAGEAKPHA